MPGLYVHSRAEIANRKCCVYACQHTHKGRATWKQTASHQPDACVCLLCLLLCVSVTRSPPWCQVRPSIHTNSMLLVGRVSAGGSSCGDEPTSGLHCHHALGLAGGLCFWHPPRSLADIPPPLPCVECHTGHPCVVVSPLIALMEDQVAALTARGVKAAMLGSAQTNPEVGHAHDLCCAACRVTATYNRPSSPGKAQHGNIHCSCPYSCCLSVRSSARHGQDTMTWCTSLQSWPPATPPRCSSCML